MESLRCRIGDLAVIVGNSSPKNYLSVVKVIDAKGYQDWCGIQGQSFVWIVEARKNRPLVYENSDESLTTLMTGPVPDQFLVPINADFDSSNIPLDIAVGVIVHCELAAEIERIKELQSSSLKLSDQSDRYSPIANCIEKYPTLTVEDVIAMANEYGF